MGTLVLLAVARLFVAPEPAPDVPGNADAHAPVLPPAAAEQPNATGESTPPLLLIDFRSRTTALESSRAAYDLRNPFSPTAEPAPATTESKRRRASLRRADLRDPFAEPSRRQRVPAARPAADLRDPFTQPAPVLPKCPDTGGVPIQRPDTVQARCAQASRTVVLARR